MTSKSNKILVIGDAHVTNNQSLRRFDWLAGLISSAAFSHVVVMGDFLTLNSLSAWDRDKRLLMEGRRFYKEIDAGNEALDKIQNAIKDEYEFNIPKLIFIEGNHEDRLPRYIQHHPEFDDSRMGIPAFLKLQERGYEWVPYRDYTSIGGIFFTHIPHGKAREISGKDICSKAEAVTVNSCVFAHTHELHTSCVHKEGQKHLQQILNAGCFFEEEEQYVKGKITNYWKGVVILDNYSYGRFDIETVSMGRLKRLYGT